MSMNKYMHPRNIYKNPPNFKQLAIQYPDFRKHVKQDITGKVSIDFKDVNCLRALSCTLLQNDFDLKVEIPVDKLIPTIPLRLNYLLWIEDLLHIQNADSERIHGIDIGTGASCVYPLIAAKKFKWNMIGTEIDKVSVECAKKNVSQNLLDEYIQVFEITQDTLLGEVLNHENNLQTFNFCMCNPPFFSTTQELHPFFKSRKSNRPHPKNAFCASVGEVVVNGGEVEFISKLIKESIEFKDRVLIFTTMVGHKSSLVPLKALLRDAEICSFKQTEFCQGRTTRWGLAWTFKDIDLRTIPTILKNLKVKPKPPLNYVIPNKNNESYTFELLNSVLMKILDELKFEVREHKKRKGCIIYEVVAYSNTWSNQRKKRRQKLKQSKDEASLDNEINTNSERCLSVTSKKTSQDFGNASLHSNKDVDTNSASMELQNTSEKLAEMDITSTTPSKREYEDDEEYYNSKKFKCGGGPDNNNYLAKFLLAMKNQNNDIILELFSFDDNTNRETIHQILQYIKNNF